MRQSVNFQIQRHDSEINSKPNKAPNWVRYNISRAVLIGTKDSYDEESNMDEICDDRRPHESQEIENLSLHNHQHLKDKDEEKDGSSTTATHFWLELPTAVSTKR